MGGYGLGVLDAVADRWGVELEPPSVWFELRLAARQSRQGSPRSATRAGPRDANAWCG